jgi:hypothetical protein
MTKAGSGSRLPSVLRVAGRAHRHQPRLLTFVYVAIAFRHIQETFRTAAPCVMISW